MNDKKYKIYVIINIIMGLLMLVFYPLTWIFLILSIPLEISYPQKKVTVLQTIKPQNKILINLLALTIVVLSSQFVSNLNINVMLLDKLPQIISPALSTAHVITFFYIGDCLKQLIFGIIKMQIKC